MGQFFMNAITTLGGVFGILIGAAIIAIVVAVGLVPLFLVRRPNELKDNPDEDLRREDMKHAKDRMSVHV